MDKRKETGKTGVVDHKTLKHFMVVMKPFLETSTVKFDPNGFLGK